MKVMMPPECDVAWVRSLSPWQLSNLADLFHQGRHLRDRTNHGSDQRWRQAGVKTYDWQSGARRTSRRDRYAHEAVVIRPRAYGYDAIGIRRHVAFVVDVETAVMSEAPEAWVPVWVWHVQPDMSTSYDPELRDECA